MCYFVDRQDSLDAVGGTAETFHQRLGVLLDLIFDVTVTSPASRYCAWERDNFFIQVLLSVVRWVDTSGSTPGNIAVS